MGEGVRRKGRVHRRRGRVWEEGRVQGGRGVQEAGEVQRGRRRVQGGRGGCRKGVEGRGRERKGAGGRGGAERKEECSGRLGKGAGGERRLGGYGEEGRVQEGSIPFQSLAPGYQLRQGRQERSLRKNAGLQLYLDSFSKGV